MRGKKAKQIRRLAEASTIGKPYVLYMELRGTRVMVNCCRKVAKAIKTKYKNGTMNELFKT